MNRFIAFDVETPNWANNRISSIGICVIENGKITEKRGTLVNPQCRFDAFNIELTGISPQMVKDSPTFSQLWPELRPLMESGILLAHNAAFDMRVLGHCLNDFGLPHERYLPYACTVRMGKSAYPNWPNHRLDTCCQKLNISLNHHRADSDSEACASLFLNYQNQGLTVQSFLRRYDFEKMCTVNYTRKKEAL